MRIVAILLFVLAGTASALGTGDRSAFARLAYARSPDFLTTFDVASTKHSHRLRAESNGAPRLHVLTVAAASHLAGCAATLHSGEHAATVRRAQRLAAKFSLPAERAEREDARRSPDLERFPSAELVARKGTVEAVEPTTPLELAARGQAIEVIGAETPPSTELATRATTPKTMDEPTPPPVEIAARGETIAVAAAGAHAAAELAPVSQAETMAREVATPERVVAPPPPPQMAAIAASSHRKSARAKSRRKSVARRAKRHRRVAQRKPAKARRSKPTIVTATYRERHTDPRRGRIPASAEKMYDINWQNSAFTYD